MTILNNIDRTPIQQAAHNLAMAHRALALAASMSPTEAASYVPHPLVIARAELINAQRYLDLAIKSVTN